MQLRASSEQGYVLFCDYSMHCYLSNFTQLMKSYIDTKAMNSAAVTHRKCSLNSNEDPLFKIFKVP